MEPLEKLICDRERGLEKYGCSHLPDPKTLAYGSSTASNVSSKSYVAAEKLYKKIEYELLCEAPPLIYERAVSDLRTKLIKAHHLEDMEGLDVFFAASGTDLHLLTAQLARSADKSPLHAIMVETSETGSGVLSALSGRHFVNSAPYNDVIVGDTIGLGCNIEVTTVPIRLKDGKLRDSAEIDDEIRAIVEKSVAEGKRVLLNTVDVSKTGLIAPSLDAILDLHQRFSDKIIFLIDACQFRLSPETLKAYLLKGFWVAVTGSKFFTGPTFSGALFLPKEAAEKLKDTYISPALRAYSSKAEWPKDWKAREELAANVNFSLLFRWEAALEEMRAFQTLPVDKIKNFFDEFSVIIQNRLASDPLFEALPLPTLDRKALNIPPSWDNVTTIFPFFLRRFGSKDGLLSNDQSTELYRLLGKDLTGDHKPEVASLTCQLGQPAKCGEREGQTLGALRMCMSGRLAFDALSPEGRGAETVISEALLALDKIAYLAKNFENK